MGNATAQIKQKQELILDSFGINLSVELGLAKSLLARGEQFQLEPLTLLFIRPILNYITLLYL